MHITRVNCKNHSFVHSFRRNSPAFSRFPVDIEKNLPGRINKLPWGKHCRAITKINVVYILYLLENYPAASVFNGPEHIVFFQKTLKPVEQVLMRYYVSFTHSVSTVHAFYRQKSLQIRGGCSPQPYHFQTSRVRSS